MSQLLRNTYWTSRCLLKYSKCFSITRPHSCDAQQGLIFFPIFFLCVSNEKKKSTHQRKKKFLRVHLRISTRYTFRRCLHWIKCRTEGNNYRFFLTIFCCITEMRMEILDNSLSRCSQNWNLTVIRKLFHWSTQVFNILSHRISNLYFKLLSLLDSRSNRINEENF